MAFGTYTEPRLEAPGVPFETRQKVPSADLNQLIDNQRTIWSKAPDFAGGGTYNPTATIVVGGSGFRFTSPGPNTITGLLDLSQSYGQLVESLDFATADNCILYADTSRRARATVANGIVRLYEKTSSEANLKIGSVIEVMNCHTSVSLAVRTFSSSSTLVTIPATVENYPEFWCEFVWSGTAWLPAKRHLA